MPSTTARRLNLGLSGDILLTVLVVVGFMSVFTVPASALTLGDYALLALTNLLYLLNGIYGWRYWDRRRTPAVGLAYFASQYALSTFIVYWSCQNMWLLLLPLASQSIELRRRWTAVICLLVMLAFLLPLALPGRLLAAGVIPAEALTPAAILEATWSFGMALVFILLFSELLVRERQARVALDEAHAQLREYAMQVEQLATIQERARLAREVHDSLGHHLTAIHVHLEAALALRDSQPALAAEALAHARALTQEGLSEVRRSVAALRAAPVEDRPLLAALTDLVDECRRAGVAADLQVIGERRPLPTPVKAALYRAAQEGLTNARKHSQARRVEVRLDYRDPARVRLAVQDDGVGAASTVGGFGLVGVRERLQLLGGQMQAHTAPGQGFILEVEAPT